MTQRVFHNARRSATSTLSSQAYTTQTPIGNLAERIAMYDDLHPINQRALAHYSTEDGQTEKDQHLFLVMTVRDDRSAIETDRAPVMVAEKVSTWNKDLEWFLPIKIITDKEEGDVITRWDRSHYRYFHWACGRIRHPRVDPTDDRSITYGIRNPKMSWADILDVYFASFYGTMTEFWNTSEDRYAEYAILIYKTIKYILNYRVDTVKVSDIQARLKLVDRLNELTTTREKTEDEYRSAFRQNSYLLGQRQTALDKASREWREFRDKTHPADWWWAMYNNIMLARRTNLPGLYNPILALLTQTMLNDEGVCLEGLEDHFLRMVWERMGRHIDRVETRGIMNIGDLISLMHKQAGRKSENQLRHWGFMMDTFRRGFFRHPGYNFKQMTAVFQGIRRQTRTVRGLTALSLLIAPGASGYLTDVGIAECVFQASTITDRQSLLDVPALVNPHAGTPGITGVIDNNNRRVMESRARAEAIQRRLEQGVDIRTVVQEARGASHFHSPSVVFTFGNLIAQLLADDDMKTIELLFEQAQTPAIGVTPVLGMRRCIALLKALQRGHVPSWLKPYYDPGVNRPDLRYNGGEIGGRAVQEEATLLTDEEQSVYVTMEEAMIIVQTRVSELELEAQKIDNSCIICLEEYDGINVVPHMLHPSTSETPHRSCVDCYGLLCQDAHGRPRCPLCRTFLTVNSTNEWDRQSDDNDSYDSDEYS